MSAKVVNNQTMQTRRSVDVKMANVDENRFYLVENVETKQRHVITHLFVKHDSTGASSNVYCKVNPRGNRFEAKILFKGKLSINISFIISNIFSRSQERV